MRLSERGAFQGPLQDSFTSWTAQIIQHEIDHCDRILIK